MVFPSTMSFSANALIFCVLLCGLSANCDVADFYYRIGTRALCVCEDTSTLCTITADQDDLEGREIVCSCPGESIIEGSDANSCQDADIRCENQDDCHILCNGLGGYKRSTDCRFAIIQSCRDFHVNCGVDDDLNTARAGDDSTQNLNRPSFFPSYSPSLAPTAQPSVSTEEHCDSTIDIYDDASDSAPFCNDVDFESFFCFVCLFALFSFVWSAVVCFFVKGDSVIFETQHRTQLSRELIIYMKQTCM